jgi:hypothetical protein
MRKLFRPLIAVLVFCLPPAFAAPAAARQYDNVRFGFSVAVGDPDWQRLPPPANGDGMAFQSRSAPDAGIVFYGRNRIGETDGIEQTAANAVPDDAENVSRTIGRQDFHIAYDHDGLHTRVRVFLADGVFYTALARAPRDALARFEPKFREILETWKIRGRPAGQWEERGK